MTFRLVLTACCCLLALGARGEVASPAEALLQLAPELSRPEATGGTLSLTRDPSQEIRDELPPLPTIDLTTPPDDLWQRVRNGFAMPDLDSPLVADRQAWYLNRPELLRRVFERSRKYLHHIVEELEKRGMPTELALLPIVESSFNPLARSPARALGIWQFIPSTGKNYNLAQNHWMDQRRDIIASTTAALDYLQNIYEMHGDWHLALASYNWGENAVARAIAKNQAKGLPTDYAHLTMPAETRYYVPKLQAIKNIVAQPELFGFRLDPIPNAPYFGTVDIDADMDIALAARLAETPLAEFIALNPAYHRPVVPGDNRSPLVIPADKVDVFRRNLERYEAEDRPLSNWQTYTLKKGEKLEAVAARFGLSAARLKQLNGITPRLKVGPGFNLLVPGKGALADAAAVASSLPQMPADAPAAKPGKKVAKGAKPGKQTAKGRPAGKQAKPQSRQAAKPKPGAKPLPPAKPRKR